MNDKSVEKLLNQLYNEVDLKTDIFNFIQPVLMKSYALLQNDKLNIQNGKADDVLFKDVEQQHMLENIIYRDLPGLIDLYVKLPIQYRNTERLKNGKTHRELLIENIEILINKLKEVEKNVYIDLDQAMTIKNKLIKEKYVSGNSNFIELNKNQFESQMDKIEVAYQYEPTAQKEYSFNYNDNKKIVLEQGNVKYKAKNTTYAVLGSMKTGAKSFSAWLSQKSRPFVNWLKEEGGEAIANVIAFVIVIGLGSSPISVPVGYFYWDHTQDIVGQNMAEVSRILNANKKMHDISVMTLNKFAKESSLDIKYKNNNEVVFTQNVNSRKCERTFSYISDQAKTSNTTWYFKVNDRQYSSEDHLSSKNVETVCDHDSNKISAVFTNLQ